MGRGAAGNRGGICALHNECAALMRRPVAKITQLAADWEDDDGCSTPQRLLKALNASLSATTRATTSEDISFV